MKNVLRIAISFIVCFFLKIPDIWLFFTAMYVLLSFNNLRQSHWEIPMGAMLVSIITAVCTDYIGVLFRIFIPTAAMVLALSCPKKLFLFFPAVAALLIFAGDKYGFCAMLAAIWCGVKLYRRKPLFNKAPI